MRIVKKLCRSDKLDFEFVKDLPPVCQMTGYGHPIISERDKKVLRKTTTSTHTQHNEVMGRREQQYIPQSPSSLVTPGRDGYINRQCYHQNIPALEAEISDSHSDFQDSDSDISYEGK